MALKSKLFARDQRIQAIADSDSQHVKPGDRGEHVRKIQMALNAIDRCGLSPDGNFGPATAAAVLQFKSKRDIVNRASQTSPDAIVGKLTIVALDNELWDIKEVTGPALLRVISPTRPRGPSKRHAIESRSQQQTFATTSSFVGGGGAPQLSTAGNVLHINSGQTAVVEIRNADGGWIMRDPRCTARVQDPLTKKPVEEIGGDPQTIEIVGGQPQTTKINFYVLRYLGFKTEGTTLIVVVHNPNDPNIIPTITPHNHQPTRKWRQLLRDIDQPTDDAVGKVLKGLCLIDAEPQTFVNRAIDFYLGFYPTAMKHLRWYLSEGHGADYIENENISNWVNEDENLRKDVASSVRENLARKRYLFYVDWTTDRYGSRDFQNTFGGIDKLFIKFDIDAQTVTIFFKDIYEWHPVCPPYYVQHSDDFIRNTNSLHAALVELKDTGAADFWMIGEATFPMSKFGLP